MSKTYLIIGASSDVGCELIREINDSEKEAVIYAHYRSTLNNISAIKESNDNSVIPIQADLSDENGVNLFLNELEDQRVTPDAIVHLATPKLEFVKFKDLEWNACEADIQVQVASIFRILQVLLPQMVKKKIKTKVVFVLSENTLKLPAKFSTKYTMSKHMLLGLMKSLAVEYREKQININAISPSMIDTKLLSNIDRRMLELSGATDKILLPNDVVPEILRLLSSESDSMYGENIYIPGKGVITIERQNSINN